MDAHFGPKRMPVEAVNYLEKNMQVQRAGAESGLLGRIFDLPALSRSRCVVVDDRHDLYGEEFFKSYLKMMHVERGMG